MGPWLGSMGAFCGKWGDDAYVHGEWARGPGPLPGLRWRIWSSGGFSFSGWGAKWEAAKPMTGKDFVVGEPRSVQEVFFRTIFFGMNNQVYPQRQSAVDMVASLF